MLLSTCDWWVTKCFSCSTLLSPFHMLRVKYRIMLGDPTQAVKDSKAAFCPSLYHCSFHMINCKILKWKLKNNFKVNFKVRSADYKNKTKENILRNKFRTLFQYKISLMESTAVPLIYGQWSTDLEAAPITWQLKLKNHHLPDGYQ